MHFQGDEPPTNDPLSPRVLGAATFWVTILAESGQFRTFEGQIHANEMFRESGEGVLLEPCCAGFLPDGYATNQGQSPLLGIQAGVLKLDMRPGFRFHAIQDTNSKPGNRPYIFALLTGFL